jgi:glycosyltransferase involved in cell wall biosynthesis
MPSRPLRILFLTHYFPPEGNAPATRVFELSRRWVNKGHRVTVITGAPNVPDGKVYEGYRNRLWQTEEMAGIHVIRVWTYLAANQGTLRRIANYLSFMLSAALAGCLTPKPDLIIATSPQFFCGWVGAFLARLRRRPFILEIRDLWPESIKVVGALRNPRLLAFLEWLEQRLYAAADHIVTVGWGYHQRLRERGAPVPKLSVIPNGVDGVQFAAHPTGASIRERYGLNGNFVCSYIGTAGLACGLDVVLRAAAKLNQRQAARVRFLIVGDGALLAKLRTGVQSAGLRNVVFTGRQPKEAMPEFLAASDACLVHLNRRELFTTVMPSKIFDALGMCRPVILGVEGFAADFIRRSGGGICIEPDNEDELISAIDRLSSDPVWARSMGQAGHDYVIKHFDRDDLAQQYLDRIQALLAAGRRPAASRWSVVRGP